MSKRKVEQKVSSLVSKGQKEPLFPTWFYNQKMHLVGMFILACLLYANTIGHDFAQDDAIVLYDNEFTTQGISGIDELFKYDTFRGFFKEEGKANLVEGGRYRPFTPVMFALEYELFGKNPMIGHLGNILLYGILCALMYLLLRLLFSQKSKQEKAIFIALIATLIFTVHPVHTEVVANIKGRDEIMTLLGSLAALYFSLKAYLEKKNTWMVLSGVFFFIGLLSKENAITFLGIVPLAFYVFTEATLKEIAIQTLPYVIVAALFLGIRANALAPPEGMSAAEIEQIVNRPKDLMNDPFQKLVGSRYEPLSFGEKTATISKTLGVYIQLLFSIAPLTHDYYPRHIEVHNWTNLSSILSLLLYLLIGFVGLFYALKKEPLGFALLFYVMTLSIVSNLFFPIGTNMAERFLFMPSVGFSVFIAILAYKATEKYVVKGIVTDFKSMRIPLMSVGLVAFVFAGQTVLRNPAWKDNFTLFLTDVKVSKNSAKLQNSAGGELIAQAVKPEFAAKKTEMLTEAIEHLKKAVILHPGYKNAYLLMGNGYSYLEQFEPSITAYNNALKLDPNYEEAENNLGIIYRNAGRYYGEKKGDIQKSMQYLTEALRRRPNDFEVNRLLGVASGQAGDNQKAIEYFTKATQIEPQNAGAWYDLGTAYYFVGKEEKRLEYHAKALQIEPDFLEKRKQGK